MSRLTEREVAMLRYALHKVWVAKAVKQQTKDEAHELWLKLFGVKLVSYKPFRE